MVTAEEKGHVRLGRIPEADLDAALATYPARAESLSFQAASLVRRTGTASVRMATMNRRRAERAVAHAKSATKRIGFTFADSEDGEVP